MVICYKQRKAANVIDTMELIGEVKGSNVILVDDMIDTGGTLAKAADLNDGKRGFKRKSNLYTRYFIGQMQYEKIENSH